jgi:hypothetical protein
MKEHSPCTPCHPHCSGCPAGGRDDTPPSFRAISLAFLLPLAAFLAVTLAALATGAAEPLAALAGLAATALYFVALYLLPL